MIIDDKKVEELKKVVKLLKKTQKRGVFSFLFSNLKEEIEQMHKNGLSLASIATILSEIFSIKISSSTLASYYYKHIAKQNKKDGVKKEEAKSEVKDEGLPNFNLPNID